MYYLTYRSTEGRTGTSDQLAQPTPLELPPASLHQGLHQILANLGNLCRPEAASQRMRRSIRQMVRLT